LHSLLAMPHMVVSALAPGSINKVYLTAALAQLP